MLLSAGRAPKCSASPSSLTRSKSAAQLEALAAEPRVASVVAAIDRAQLLACADPRKLKDDAAKLADDGQPRDDGGG